jgi:hypothetical protein
MSLTPIGAITIAGMDRRGAVPTRSRQPSERKQCSRRLRNSVRAGCAGSNAMPLTRSRTRVPAGTACVFTAQPSVQRCEPGQRPARVRSEVPRLSRGHTGCMTSPRHRGRAASAGLRDSGDTVWTAVGASDTSSSELSRPRAHPASHMIDANAETRLNRTCTLSQNRCASFSGRRSVPFGGRVNVPATRRRTPVVRDTCGPRRRPERAPL